MTEAGPGPVEPVNLLLVDDREGNLLALQAVLAAPDYRLITARSGAEALKLVLKHEFAVILLDVAMPGMDGFETAALIKSRPRSARIPIIFVTASIPDVEHIFKGYSVGAVDYLRKPVDLHVVRAKVAVFAELYRQRRQI
ncbi:MAG: two-component system response regulator, partial [Myxococcales bacterium]